MDEVVDVDVDMEEDVVEAEGVVWSFMPTRYLGAKIFYEGRVEEIYANFFIGTQIKRVLSVHLPKIWPHLKDKRHPEPAGIVESKAT